MAITIKKGNTLNYGIKISKDDVIYTLGETDLDVIPVAFAKPDQNDPTDHNTASLISFTNTSATGYAKRTISFGAVIGMEEDKANCNVQVVVEGYK